MTEEQDMYVCNNHATAINYRGKECPWCSFKDDMAQKLISEYRRGFEDGVKAADTENAKKESAVKAKFVTVLPEMQGRPIETAKAEVVEAKK